MKIYSGSCLCGAASFEVHGEFVGFFLCHCSRCRKETGSAHGANLFSKSAKFVWTNGLDRVKTFKLPDTRFQSSFCDTCGSKLPTVDEHRIVVPAGSLDCDVDIRPNAHIFSASKANWEHDLDEVRRFDALPE